MKKKDKITIVIAFVVAILISARFIQIFSRREGLSFTESFHKSLPIFIFIVIFMLVAYISGGRRYRKGQMIVSPWFGAFVAGSFFLFWMGGIYANNLYYGGSIAVALWGAIVLSIWAVTRIIRKTKKTKGLTTASRGTRD
jgi:hypothetical protein